MATKSFYQNMYIETEEEGQILLKAFEESDKRPYTPPEFDINEVLKEGIRWVREGGLDGLIAAQREKAANKKKD